MLKAPPFHRVLLSALLLAGLLAPSLGCRLYAVRPETIGLSSAKLEAIDRLLAERVEKKQLAGAVALVSRRGHVAYLETAGMQDIEAGRPMAADTIFRICSMTKPITSAAAMILVDDGKLSLSDPVSKYLPELKGLQVAERRSDGSGAQFVNVPARREITVLDLLTHTAGFTYGFFGREHFAALYQKAGVSDGLAETDGTIADNVRRLAAVPLLHQPGTAWQYGLSTDVLGRVIEVASGMTLEEFFRTRLFEPMGMKDTSFRLPPSKKPRLAAVYRPRPNGTIERLPEEGVKTEFSRYTPSYPYAGSGQYYSGGAGLVSTARDYARFLQMLLNGGQLGDERIITRASVELMTKDHCKELKPSVEDHGDGFGLGFGVVTEAAPGRPLGTTVPLGSVGTYSWGGFYYTYFWVDPKEELIGVFLSQLHPWGNLNVWSEFRGLVYQALEPR